MYTCSISLLPINRWILLMAPLQCEASWCRPTLRQRRGDRPKQQQQRQISLCSCSSPATAPLISSFGFNSSQSHLLPPASPWVEPLNRAELVSSVEAAHHIDLSSKHHSCCVRPRLLLNKFMIREMKQKLELHTKGLAILHWLVSTSYTSTELSLSTVLSGARPPIAKIFPLRAANAGKLRPCLMEESRCTWIFIPVELRGRKTCSC